MTIGSTRASTQDNTDGTPVATVTAEDSGAGALQATVPVGNKTTYSETSRTGLTDDDTSEDDLTTAGFGSTGLADLGNALSVEVRALSAAGQKTLTGRLVFYNASSTPLSVSESVSFTTDESLMASGTRYVSRRVIVDVGQARFCKFYIDSISASSTWDVHVRPI